MCNSDCYSKNLKKTNKKNEKKKKKIRSSYWAKVRIRGNNGSKNNIEK